MGFGFFISLYDLNLAAGGLIGRESTLEGCQCMLCSARLCALVLQFALRSKSDAYVYGLSSPLDDSDYILRPLRYGAASVNAIGAT